MEFDAKKETENIVKFIKDYYIKNDLAGAVVGLSGGKDSAVVLALFVRALGKENVVAISLPCHSIEIDKNLAEVVAKEYCVTLYNLDLTKTYDEFIKGFEIGFGKTQENNVKNSNINLKPRLRMSSLYYYAALFSELKGKTYLVAGTGNKCEQYVGYFTKGGDGVCDISVLADLTVSEVIKIGEVLKVPEEVLYRAPSDGISGQTDEEKLGVTYADIEKVINGESVSKETLGKIEKMHINSRHKFDVPTYKKSR